MNLLCYFLAPALLVVVSWAELIIMPSVKPHLHDLTTGSRSPITFSCQWPGETVDSGNLQWFDNQDNAITATSGGKFVSNSGDRLTLRIVDGNDDDAGTYTCRGNKDGVDEQGSIGLEVYRGINVTSPAKQYAIQGTNARVWCRMVKTSTQKTVSWFKSGWREIKSDDKYTVGYDDTQGSEGDYLEIKDVALEDSDKYICDINMWTIGKSLAHFIDLTVTVPPTFDGPLVMSPMVARENERLVMTCKASGTPAPTYRFTKDGQELSEEESSDGEYVIESVSRQDEGLYACIASNQGGQESQDMVLDVKIPPIIENNQNMTQGEDTELRMDCVATGDPAPAMFWRRKDSQVYFLTDAQESIYVEESAEAPEQDQATRVYRKTLTLVISKLRYQDAGEYVCKAGNDVADVEKTFKIDVTYKPKFGESIVKNFYGWEGSKTNLTCIADGNPAPVIDWFRDDQDLKDEAGYNTVYGQKGVLTRTISYLLPTVDNSNLETVFGAYICKASNIYGSNEEVLNFERAMVPDLPSVEVVHNKPTELELTMKPPVNNGFQPVFEYIISYHELSKADEKKTKIVQRQGTEASTQGRVEGLKPDTQYSLSVSAVNNVGHGNPKTFMEKTALISKPDPVTVKSSASTTDAFSYRLEWNVPMTGGADITNYRLEYAVAEEVDTSTTPWTAVRVSTNAKTVNLDGTEPPRHTLTGLNKNTYYQVKVKAINRIGSSDETAFIFKTGAGVGASDEGSSVRASVAGLVLVVMVTACLQPLLG